MTLFSSQPERFSVHRVRGETVKDTVAQVSGERVYLAQFLNGLEEGHYHLMFALIARGGELTGWRSEPIEVDGEHVDANETATVKGLHPGLYEARLDATDFSKTFWVLFVDDETYSKLNDEFRRISTAIQSWGEDIPQSIKDSYRRAYLAYLDQQLGTKSAERAQ